MIIKSCKFQALVKTTLPRIINKTNKIEIKDTSTVLMSGGEDIFQGV